MTGRPAGLRPKALRGLILMVGMTLIPLGTAPTSAATIPAPSCQLPVLAATLDCAIGQPQQLPTKSRALAGIYCTSTANCWAVGYQESKKGAELNQIQHWNGKKWAQVSAPSPGGFAPDRVSQLNSVRCVFAADCWAVGFEYNGTGGDVTQALHWDGSSWKVTKTPDPAGTVPGSFSELIDVACTSAASCWAVGQYGTIGGSEQTNNLAVHWNGKKWYRIPTPNPAGTSSGDQNSLESVRCTSVSNCWAVGGTSEGIIFFNEALRWNGHKWSTADVPQPGGIGIDSESALEGLACTSASNCWAVGLYASSGLLNQALHWNGASWALVKMPNPDGTGTNAFNLANAVNCSAASNCWAVGYYGNAAASTPVLNEMLHWKGTKWATVKVAQPGGSATGDHSSLASIRCVSAKDCWAAGAAKAVNKPDHDQLLHWNSTKWSVS